MQPMHLNFRDKAPGNFQGFNSIGEAVFATQW